MTVPVRLASPLTKNILLPFGSLHDDYMRMNESTYHEAIYLFCEDVIVVFGKYYLREPNTNDTAHLLSINKSRGFLGCWAA
jgi:hypothetical protein